VAVTVAVALGGDMVTSMGELLPLHPNRNETAENRTQTRFFFIASRRDMKILIIEIVD
jgi:hypothetical protein